MAVRILATSMLYGNAVFELAEKLPELKLVEFRSAEWERLLPEAEALIITLNNVFTSEDILKAKKLKAIGTFSVGVNHLPLKLCEEKNIKIVNTPGVLTDATADISLALLLAVARRIVEADELVRNGEWKGWTPGFMLGTELSGKVCGIMGSGPIGQAVARRVHALGMKVVFWDREGSGKPVDFGYDVAERLPLDALLKISNVLSLNCPLTEQTKCLLSKVKLQLLPKGAIIVNAARGGIVDEMAVMDLLDDGYLGGAGFDVFDSEPALNPRWMTTPRTVLLPHLGSATSETRSAMAQMACDGVAKVLQSS